MSKNSRKTKNFFNRHGSICFYTGINCVVGDANSVLSASREHLVPQKRRCKAKIKNNIVVAASQINSVIGNAPLKVKYMIKKEIREFIKTLPEDMTDVKKIRKCCNEINEIFDELRVFGYLPWEVYNGSDATEKRVLHRVYNDLLTPEEQWVIFGGYND
jgi:hypothetical protein